MTLTALVLIIAAAAVRFIAPASYTVLVLGLAGILITPVVLGRYGYRPVIAEWRAQRWRIVLLGILMVLTYILVLQTYAMARARHVGALREPTIVLAALARSRWLGPTLT